MKDKNTCQTLNIKSTKGALLWDVSYIVNEYDQEQSQSARKEEPHNNQETPERQTKQSNRLSLPLKPL